MRIRISLRSLTLGLSIVAGGIMPATAALGAGTASFGELLNDPATHELVLRDGRTLQVRLLEERDEDIVVEVVLSGIRARQTFARADILAFEPLGGVPDASSEQERLASARHRVYVADLEGDFGREITPTSFGRVMRDASNHEANVIVLHLDGDWKQVDYALLDRYDDDGNFDQFFQAQRFLPAIREDLNDKNRWPERPQVVFWISNAMQGLAFLPMATPDIYFTPDGRMGGIGNLDEISADEDPALAAKFQSARRAIMDGWMLEGGHDPVIAQAMSRQSTVLSYRVRNGKVEFLRDYPESDAGGGWTLLTDDGLDEREDTDAQIVRNQGNDVLTLRADIAKQIGFSAGTASDTSELLQLMGMGESAVVLDDRDKDGFTDSADRVIEGWTRGIDETAKLIRRVNTDLAETNEPARRLVLLRRLLAIYEAYGDVFDPNEQRRIDIGLQIEEIRNAERLARAAEREQGGSAREGNGPREGSGNERRRRGGG